MANPNPDHETIVKLQALVERGRNGDQSASAETRALINSPAGKLVVNAIGDIATQADHALLRRMAHNPVVRDTIQGKLEVLAEELGRPNDSAIERLLVQRVVSCWLQLAHADFESANDGQMTFVEGEFWQRRQDRAHKRFLSAVKTLAVVRRLALPIKVDVNLAGEVATKTTEKQTPQRQRFLPIGTN